MKRAVLVLSLGSLLGVVPSAWAAISDPVKIDTGQLSGASTGTSSVRVFKGIPFAAPPTGENRWRAPQPAAKWEGVRAADAFGPQCTAGAGGGRGGGRGGARGAAPGAAAAPGAPAAAPAPAPPAAAPQAPAAPRPPAASEDCLYVNVWTSANRPQDRRPVMVWIYGGGFTGGSGSMPWYDGEALAAKGPVVVTFNYRLGALGFFAHPELAKESGHNASGNYGMMDAISVLQWVKKNINAFGGNPDNVTIFGESAGAIMIGALVGSPQAKGLFNRAIAESGAWMGLQMARMTPGAQRQEAGARSLETAGIKSIAELRAKPLAELPNLGGAGLVIDGYLIPEDLSITFANGKQNDVDVLAGSNKDESNFLGGGRGGRGGARGGGEAPAPGAAVQAYTNQARTKYGELADAYLKLYPAAADADVAAANAQSINDEISWNMRQFAAAQSKKGKKGYAYFFTRVPLQNGQPQTAGATHTAEIAYVFNHPQGGGQQPLEWNDVDRKLADTMSSYWVNFATKGDPNGPGLPAWPQYKDMSKDKVMVLGDTVQVEATPPAEKLSFYNSAHARMMKNPGTN